MSEGTDEENVDAEGGDTAAGHRVDKHEVVFKGQSLSMLVTL